MADDRLPKIRGELENFARDVIEYFQKTGLIFPPSLNTVAERIALTASIIRAERLDRPDREKIAEFLWENEKNISAGWDYLKYKAFHRLPDNTQNMFLKKADQLLTILPDKDKEIARIFEEIEKTGVLRGHRYITEGTIRQDETHYPERCGLCNYQALKSKFKEKE